MTILVMFHEVRYRDFKTFYAYVVKYWSSYFTHLPSYSCFINRMKETMLPLTLFVQLRSGQRTGIYYIDSSCLPVCHLKRSKCHRTFAQIAQYGKTSVGWFFGLKLHLVINDKGQLIAFKMTQGNRHDGKEGESLLTNLEGLAFGDKGYIGKEVMQRLLGQGLKLITRQRKNMKKDDPFIVIREVRENAEYKHKDVTILLNTANQEKFKEGAYKAANNKYITTNKYYAKLVTDKELIELLTSISERS